MDDASEELLNALDGHDVEGTRTALRAGANPCTTLRGKPPVVRLLEDYGRSDSFCVCMRLLLEHGAELPDPIVAPVLLNDASEIVEAINLNPAILYHRTSLRSAFSSLDGVTLLHVAAEYGNFEAARALVEAGADVNARADVDENGLNGHTPIFHTVNSAHNRSALIMKLLLAAGARTDIQIKGLRWGRSYEWETTFLDVTPISYAQMGLLPQVHRRESEIYDNIRCMLLASGRGDSSLNNIPNRYMQSN